jgi:hypothetical protein
MFIYNFIWKELISLNTEHLKMPAKINSILALAKYRWQEACLRAAADYLIERR